jgi:hypothetical protein
MRKTCVAIGCMLLTLATAEPCLAANPVFELLINRGVTIAPGESLQLPQPTLPDGLTAAAQRAAVEAIPENRYAWDALTRKSAVAPFILKSYHGEERADHIARRLDVWFVLYGDLQTLGSDAFVSNQFNLSTGDSSIKKLSDADLARRGLTPPKRPSDPRYVAATFSIFDRVRLTATTRETKTETKESILTASVIDPRFASDPQFANSWRSITRDEAGSRQLGPPHPYVGFGSYVKATRLIDPAGAVLVEYHLVFAEPTGWFNGANLLGSKLSILAQEVIRGARRALDSKRNAE